MKQLKEKFLEKYPLYPNSYQELVRRLTRVADVSKSSGTDEEQFERGKAFGTVYECFMYATMIGIKARYRVPFEERGASGIKFLQTKDWKPVIFFDYIFMSLIALSKDQLEELEDLNEEQSDIKALDLAKMMEQYAKGGFELMVMKERSLPNFFENPGNVVTYLKEITPIN